MSDPYLELEEEPNPYLDASIPERAANAAKAGAQGVVTSVGESISGAARTADTIREGSLLTGVPVGSEKPTMRQERKAFERAMNDPRYLPALANAGDDPTQMLKAEQFFGPKAKLDVIRTPIEEGRKMSAQESAAQQKRLDLDSPMYAFGKGLVEAGKEVYATDPYLDLKPESKLARSMGSTLPSVGLSLIPGVGTSAAVSQYALSQSEDMAQEAINAGRPDLAMQSATAGLFIGALSEATLGATARLGTILKNPTKVAALEGWAKANPIKATALIAGVRETAQEGTEQVMQNLTASDVVGYDPERPWHRQVLESMVLGGVGGALFGGGGALVRKATTPKSKAKPTTSDDKAVALEELNQALDALQQEGRRITELEGAPPAIEGTQGELIPVPPGEAQPEVLTGQQRMAREAVNAMAELRALKEAAKQSKEVSPNEAPQEKLQTQKGQPEVKVAPQSLISTPQIQGIEERPAPTIETPPSPPAESRVQPVSAPEAQAPEAARPAEPVASPAPEPQTITAAEFESLSGRFLRNAVRADNGKIYIGDIDEHHGDTIARLKESGVPFTGSKPQHRGWVWAGPDAKSTYIDVADVEQAKGDFQQAFIAKRQTTKPTETSSKVVEHKPAKGTKRPTLGPRPDGIPDVLDAIADLGGIKAPGSQKGTAEYDGYAAAFNQGGPASVLRGGSNRPDLLLQQLQAIGYNYETVDDMYAAASKAAAARDALTAQLKAERTVRPEMVERVQTLYDAAKAGQPVVPDQLMELEASLSQKELRTLKGPLAELAHMAGVAPTETGESAPIAQAKAGVREAWDAFKVVGIMPDPKADARKVFDLYKALFKLASAYVKEGMKSAKDFAAKIGRPHDAMIDAAWNDAVAGKARSNPDELDAKVVSEIVDGFRDRKFSRRFAEDQRIAPAIRQQTGNSQYQPVPNTLTVAEAFAVIQQRGIAEAQAFMMDETNALTPRVRATLGQAIILQANHDFGKTGDEAALDRSVTVAEWLTDYGTRLGQGVQAFAIWNRLTPDGMVRAYVRTVQKAQERVRKQNPNAKPGELKIPEVDKDTVQKIRKATAEAEAKPEGFQRDEAMADVLGMIGKAKGITLIDLTTALWYANILSGYPSWLRNGMGNLGMLLAEATTHAVTRPQHVPAILTGLFHGIGVGVPQAIAVLRSGKQTGHRVGKIVESPRVLELVTFGKRGGLEGARLPAAVRSALENPLAYPLNAWKYVFRIMSATDMIAFESAMEMHARFLARELVRTGKADGKTYAELLAMSADANTRARSQATAEGLTGINYRRRIAEIIQQQRPDALQSAAAQDALYATFNQHPRGVLGVIAGHISEMSNQNALFRLVVPFTNIVSNVLNNTLDYTPWGYRRLFPSVMLKDRAGEQQNWMPEDASPVDYQLQAARATLGTIGLAAIWALTQAHKDDDDPAFDVTARGPDNPNDRDGLKETGWKPYSVKVGNRWVSYQQSVLAPGMAWIGSLRDAQRLKKWTDMDDWSRFAYAGKAVAPAIMSQSFVSGLRDFLQDMSDDYVDPNGPKFRFASRTVGTVVPAAVKAVDRAFDPTIYDSQRFPAALLRDIPFVRSSQLKPALNALGEPVRPPDNFLYNLENPDAVWELLARKQAFPSKPSLTTTIRGRPITPEEQYAIIESSGPAIRRRLLPRLPAYAVLPDELVQKRVDDIVREERDKARARLGLK